MSSAGVKTVFDTWAQTYDRARRQLVSCFDDFYATVLDVIPYPRDASVRVLDLGAGTGLLSLFVAQRFRNATITLVDVSDEMLALARRRFRDSPGRFSFVTADYAESPIAGEFEVVVSALSIHHLPDPQKAALFGKIHESLVPAGAFVNADQVLGSTPQIEEMHARVWLSRARERDVSDEDLAAAFERMKEDKMSTLDAQLSWLRAAGFVDVDCFYKNLRFAVFGGRKGACTAPGGDAPKPR
jgi:tRNA (cmo5U34)-methyltransferase